MKFLVVIAAALLATASAQTACDTTKLLPLLQDSDLQACTKDSGLTLPPAGPIAEATLTKACASAGCQGLLKKVLALNLGDCSIATFKIESDLINPLKTACAKAGTGAKEAGSGSGKAEATVTVAPTTAPTTAPTSAGSAESASATTTVPAAGVPTPTPTPTKASAASAVTVAAGAAVAAVAASLW